MISMYKWVGEILTQIQKWQLAKYELEKYKLSYSWDKTSLYTQLCQQQQRMKALGTVPAGG